MNNDCSLLYLVSSTAEVKWASPACRAGDGQHGNQLPAHPGNTMVIRYRRILSFLVCTFLWAGIARALRPPMLAAQTTPAYVDPEIKAALNEISPGQIQSDIEKLVSFQTRATISAQDAGSISQGRGIGAAREWIKSELERYSRECTGCLEVETDSFTQPVSERVPAPLEITNVYAVLKGTNAEDAKRVVLVTGHYDSRNSD